MKEENEITEEVRDLLDSLEQHGQNARRQKELSVLIDCLAEDEKPAEMPHQHGKLIPLWWAIGAAAAVLLLWLLARPAMKKTPNINEEVLVEETGTKDTMMTQEKVDFIEESNILEEPVSEQLLTEETPIKTKKTQTKSTKPTQKVVEDASKEPFLAENKPSETIFVGPTKSTDTSSVGSITIPSIEEENLSPSTSHLSPPSSSQRRVIRSLNLVCYECQKEPLYPSQLSPLNSHLENTIFGQPQDPNMKNGSLAFELKLH